MTYPDTIPNESLSQLPRVSFDGPITVVESAEQIEAAIAHLLTSPIIGFDTETKPCFTRGVRHTVALLQLCSGSEAFLFRLVATQIPKPLKELLESPKHIKVGAAIRDDIKALYRVKSFVARGFVDLQTLMPQYGIREMGVKKMAGIVLQVQISKAQQLSNWENPVLTEAQKRYAATDAWICREIYVQLNN